MKKTVSFTIYGDYKEEDIKTHLRRDKWGCYRGQLREAIVLAGLPNGKLYADPDTVALVGPVTMEVDGPGKVGLTVTKFNMEVSSEPYESGIELPVPRPRSFISRLLGI